MLPPSVPPPPEVARSSWPFAFESGVAVGAVGDMVGDMVGAVGDMVVDMVGEAVGEHVIAQHTAAHVPM